MADNEHPLPAEIRSIPDRPSVRFRSEYEDVVATALLRMIARDAVAWPALATALVAAEQESRLDMIELLQIWENWYYSVHQTPKFEARIDEIVRSLKSALTQRAREAIEQDRQYPVNYLTQSERATAMLNTMIALHQSDDDGGETI